MRSIIRFILKLIEYPLLGLVYFYKYAISPLTPASCRHTPTCSEYMIQAIKIHGPFIGFYLGIKRLSHCHPWGTHGYDPVPEKGSLQFKFPGLKLKRKVANSNDH